MTTKLKSFKGHTFNRLTIMEDGTARDKVLCLCICGNSIRIRRSSVTNGRTKSCGCLQKEKSIGNEFCLKHGFADHPLYDRWMSMISRCYNPNNCGYKDYGAKGVYVCERWRGDSGLKSFIEDMMPTWFEGANLDKDKFAKPNEPKCYSPETCCWITAEENTFIRNNSLLYPIKRDDKDPYLLLEETSKRSWLTNRT